MELSFTRRSFRGLCILIICLSGHAAIADGGGESFHGGNGNNGLFELSAEEPVENIQVEQEEPTTTRIRSATTKQGTAVYYVIIPYKVVKKLELKQNDLLVIETDNQNTLRLEKK